MKKLTFLFIIAVFVSCDSILNQNPRDQYSENIVWNDINMAEKYLNGVYHGLDIQNGWNSIMKLDASTDDVFFIHIFGSDLYLQGNLTPASQGPFAMNSFYSRINWDLYDNIYKTNQFLANVDNIINNNDSNNEELKERIDIMKGEAMFLRALCYTKLALTYGGLPIITEPAKIGDDFLSIKRSSFKETVEFISKEYDLAAEMLLPKDEMKMGRATKGAALAFKSRLLLFAASDLTADGNAQNQLVGYQNPDREGLWKKAKDAALAVINLGTYDLDDFGTPDKKEVANSYYNFFKQKDLSNNEIIWGKMFRQGVGDTRQTNLYNGPNGNSNFGSNNPTPDLVDSYRMEDGSDFFEHFKIDEDGYYVNVSQKYESNNPYDNREPRFYGSILYDGAKWQQRFSNLQDRDPIGIYDRRTRIVIENGDTVSVTPGIDTRQGPVTPEDGGYTGYLMKKHMDDEIIGRDENNNNAWISIRYAEIILNYAETLIELGELSKATIYLNKIRNRGGLPNFTGENIEEALRRERRIELAFEELRWYDIRRWKILKGVIDDAKGVSITEITKRDSGTVTTTWKQINVQERRITDDKFYWIPIPFTEISKAPQLEQNPGY